MKDDEIVRVATDNSLQEAHLWRQALEEEVIICRIVGEYLGSFGITPPGHPEPEIWVHRDDANRARAILIDQMEAALKKTKASTSHEME